MSKNKRKTEEPTKRGKPWLRVSFFLLVLFLVIVPFTQIPERFTKLGTAWIEAFRGRDPRPEPKTRPSTRPKRKPTYTKLTPPTPPKEQQSASDDRTKKRGTQKPVVPTDIPKPRVLLPEKIDIDPVSDVREMTRGLQLETGIEYSQGGLASDLRIVDSNYKAALKLEIAVPEPARDLAAIAKAQPKIEAMLKDGDKLFEKAKVSPFFYQLYDNKQKRIRKELTSLGKILTRHNFYDCQSILELRHPKSKRKVLWVQADMDVVSDGSDGDRLAKMPEEIVNSTHYQPFTSYGWPKTSRTPNPMIQGWKQRIKNAEKEIADSSTSADRRKWLVDRKAYLKRGISDMESRSFLIAEYDPFVVMPINLITYRGRTLSPSVGDFVVVIHGDKLYPAIVGDAGPSFKAGEASLRLAREIRPSASPYARPVSDLSVSYLVFPGTANKQKSAPDYAAWRTHCAKLIEEIGGLGEGYQLHSWKDLLAPQPEDEEVTPS